MRIEAGTYISCKQSEKAFVWQMFFKVITKNLIFYFVFLRTVQIISMLHQPFVDLMAHFTNKLLTGWLIRFD